MAEWERNFVSMNTLSGVVPNSLFVGHVLLHMPLVDCFGAMLKTFDNSLR